MTESGSKLGQRIRRNIAWKTAATAIEKLLRLGLIVVAARLMGPDRWGQYTYALTIAFLAVQLSDLGLSLFVSRELAREQRIDADFLAEVLGLKVSLAVLYGVAMLGVALWHHAETNLIITLGLCAVIAMNQSLLELASHVFRGIQDLSLEAKATTVMAICQVSLGGLALATLWWAPELGDAVIVYVAALALAGCLGSWLAWRQVQLLVEVRVRFSKAMAIRFQKEVLPLGIAIVASLLYYKIDVPMIRAFHGDTQTGLYTASYKILEVLAIVPSIVMAATFPALSERVTNARSEALRLHQISLRWLAIAGVVVGAILAIGPEWIVAILYGDRFAMAAGLLPILGLSVVLVFVNYLQTHMLVALGLVRAQMWISLSLIGVNVGLNWLWIPSHGGIGAAWATLVTELCLLLAVSPLVYKALRHDHSEATQ